MSRMALILLLLVVPGVRGGWTLAERLSMSSIEGQLVGPPPPDDSFSRTITRTGFEPYESALYDHVEYGYNEVSCVAKHESSLSSTRITAESIVHADIYDDDDTAIATVHSWSSFSATFYMAQPTPIELTGHVWLPTCAGSPDPFSSHVRLSRWTSSGAVTLFEVVDQNATYEFIHTLAPGRYIVDGACEIGGDAAAIEGSLHGWTCFDLDLTAVPEPSTGLILGVCLGIAARRRG